MKRATLTITVDYDDSPDDATIEALLRDVARLAAGNGMLSGDGEITVDSWDCDVKIGEQDDPVRGVWARFQPQAWVNDTAIDIDGARSFDVTMVVEQMGPDKAMSLKDNSQEADELWHTYADSRGLEHDGPFRIEVAEAIREFYGL